MLKEDIPELRRLFLNVILKASVTLLLWVASRYRCRSPTESVRGIRWKCSESEEAETNPRSEGKLKQMSLNGIGDSMEGTVSQSSALGQLKIIWRRESHENNLLIGCKIVWQKFWKRNGESNPVNIFEISQCPQKPRQGEQLIHRRYYEVTSAVARLLLSFRCQVIIWGGQIEETAWCYAMDIIADVVERGMLWCSSTCTFRV